MAIDTVPSCVGDRRVIRNRQPEVRRFQAGADRPAVECDPGVGVVDQSVFNGAATLDRPVARYHQSAPVAWSWHANRDED